MGGQTGPKFRKGRGNLEPFVDEWGVDFVRIDMFPTVGFDFVWLLYFIVIWFT